MPVQTVIKVRRDTAANWTSTNPTLAAGELGLETDTNLFKFGNGTAAWTALGYSSSSRTTQIAKNDTGASAAKGSVVYISGANGANALFSLADADTELTSSKTVGLLAQTLATNGIGAIVTEGLLTGLNTGSATAGQSVWLSSTAGGFVFGAPPAKPAHSVYLGVVTRANATQGEILVKVQNGYELEELHNVSITSETSGDVLTYDSQDGLWKNAQPTITSQATANSLGTVYGQTDDSGDSNTLLGYGITKTGALSAAVGNAATVDNASVSVGYSSDSSIYATAVGYQANAGEASIALGADASASQYGIAIGRAVTAGTSEIVIGDSAFTSALKIPGVGIDTTLATNGQLLIWNSTAGGSGTGAFEWGTITVPEAATSTTLGTVYGATDGATTFSTALGYNATAPGNTGIAIGYSVNSDSDSNESIAIGAYTTNIASAKSVAIGRGATTTNGYHGVAIGSADSTGTGVAIGRYASSGDSGVAIGPMASAASGGIGIGPYANAGASEIVIGDFTITALKIPGVGIDTTTASDGQALVWDTDTSKFVWQGVASTESPTFTGTTTISGALKIKPVIETVKLVNTGFSGYSYYLNEGAVQYITANSTGTSVVNIEHSFGMSLDDWMSVGESTTVVLQITNGSTAYYINSVMLDAGASTATVKWMGGTAPTSGNANAIDAYTFTIIKTAAATFTVLASVNKFA